MADDVKNMIYDDADEDRVEYRNHEGYPDPTAYYAERSMRARSGPLAAPKIRGAEDSDDYRARLLINALRNMVELAGFECLGRFNLRDKKSGRIYR